MGAWPTRDASTYSEVDIAVLGSTAQKMQLHKQAATGTGAGYHGPRPAGPTRQIPCSPPTSHEPRHRRLTKRHKLWLIPKTVS